MDAPSNGPARPNGAASEPLPRPGTREQVKAVAALLAGADDGPADDADGDAADDRPGGEAPDAQQQDEGTQGQQEGAGDQGDDEADELGDDEQAEGKPANLAEAAKRLGLSTKELNDLVLNHNEHALTLGEIKSRMGELANLDKARAELDDARGRVELHRVDTERRSRAMLDAIPPGALPELEARVMATHRETLRRESELLMSARPKWADQTYSSAERERMSKVAAPYGFSKAEIGAMLDHRQVLLLQDFAALKERVEAGKAAAKRQLSNGNQQVRGETAAGGKPQPTRRSTQDEKARSVARLMRG